MSGSHLIAGTYRIKQRIGRGSFGEIYAGVDVRTNEQVAVKVEELNTKYPQLLDEYQVYRNITATKGFPKVYWCGTHNNRTVMVMELLGDSLETLYNKCGRKFSLKTVLMLAIQILHRIEHQHNNHYLHRDIKPDNFVMGIDDKKDVCNLIDMGLCKRFRDPVTLKHIPYRDNKKLIGTPRYASINTHRGIEQCRRDDLESIGYMLMYFNIGKLPWQGLHAKTKQEKYEKISNKKSSISVDVLCENHPVEFCQFLTYCRQLRFTHQPDYSYLRGLFVSLYRKKQFPDDGLFDWMDPNFNRGSVPREGGQPTQGLPCSMLNPMLAVNSASRNAAAVVTPADRSVENKGDQDKYDVLLQAYTVMEQQRDRWRRKTEEKDKLIARYKRENTNLKRHLAMYCAKPYNPSSQHTTTSATSISSSSDPVFARTVQHSTFNPNNLDIPTHSSHLQPAQPSLESLSAAGYMVNLSTPDNIAAAYAQQFAPITPSNLPQLAQPSHGLSHEPSAASQLQQARAPVRPNFELSVGPPTIQYTHLSSENLDVQAQQVQQQRDPDTAVQQQQQPSSGSKRKIENTEEVLQEGQLQSRSTSEQDSQVTKKFKAFPQDPILAVDC
mmetsp:Transcript_34144/g.67266  ORF Transcript_34144/g.67266 Transcript_34144/m.67266 type:complete len:610 (+) Transcript_34144:43-1872(+)